MKHLFNLIFKSNSAKTKTNEFKTFFRVGLDDKPASLYRKAREVWKVNPYIRRMIRYSKVIFAVGFIFYFSPGTNMPG